MTTTLSSIVARALKVVLTATFGLLAIGGWLIVGIAGEIVLGMFRFMLAILVMLLSFAASIALFIWILTL